jgi:hypothetical protein
MPHRPKTTLGIAASISIIVLKMMASRGGRKSWVRKIATIGANTSTMTDCRQNRARAAAA